jgi:hypothetical protein
VTSSGIAKSRGGVSGCAPFMNCNQIGSAAVPPVALIPIGLESSRPIHTPQSRSAVKPTNQASFHWVAVPVLPAAGRPSSCAFFAVPRSTGALSRSTMR